MSPTWVNPTCLTVLFRTLLLLTGNLKNSRHEEAAYLDPDGPALYLLEPTAWCPSCPTAIVAGNLRVGRPEDPAKTSAHLSALSVLTSHLLLLRTAAWSGD